MIQEKRKTRVRKKKSKPKERVERTVLESLQYEATFKFILEGLALHDYNITHTAKYLGVSTMTIHRYLSAHGVTPKGLRNKEEVVEFEHLRINSNALAPKVYQFKSFEHLKDVLGGLAIQNIIRESKNTISVQMVLNESADSVADIIDHYTNHTDTIIKASWRKIRARK